MKTCDYCGRPNEDASIFCSECGSGLASTDENPNRPRSDPGLLPKNQSHILNARSATLIFGADLVPALLFGVLYAVLMVMHDRTPMKQSQSFIKDVLPIMELMLPLVSGLVTVLVAKALIPDYLSDTSPTGAAWKRGSWGLSSWDWSWGCPWVSPAALLISYSGIMSTFPP